MIQQEPHSETGANLRVDVYVRARPADRTQCDAVVETLRTCHESGRIADLNVDCWPKDVSLANELLEDPAVAIVDEFERWAAENGVSLEPAFDVRSVHSSITGEKDRVLSLPSICIACYNGDELVAVFPCSNDDRTITVPDAIEALAGGDVDTLIGPFGVSVGTAGDVRSR